MCRARGQFGRPAIYTQTEEHQVQRGVDSKICDRSSMSRQVRRAQHFAFVLQPRQSGWSQWHASAVMFFESWQIWLQYFCLSGTIQLQAGCAHFLVVPAISVLLTFTNPAALKKARLDRCSDAKGWDWVSQNHEIFPIIARRRPVDQAKLLKMRLCRRAREPLSSRGSIAPSNGFGRRLTCL